jgi:hypothetical protein
MLTELFKWWYGLGWYKAWKNIGYLIKKAKTEFALPVLISSLFAPWKQIVTLPGRSLDEKLRALIDNLVSRTIGFFVRLLTLMAAAVVIGVSSIFGLIGAIIWPFLPPLTVYLLIRTITG